jgi:hypothetical protein
MRANASAFGSGGSMGKRRAVRREAAHRMALAVAGGLTAQ